MDTSNFVLSSLRELFAHDAPATSAGLTESQWRACWKYSQQIHARVPFLLSAENVAQSQKATAQAAIQKERMLMALLDDELDTACAALAAEKIDVLVVKGMDLGRRFYRKRLHRPMTDVDLLVKAERFEDSIAALLKSGYRIAGSFPKGRFRVELSRHPSLPVIELHSRLLASDTSADTNAYWQTALDGEPYGLAKGCKVLDPSACFSYLLRHGCVQHVLESALWFFDLYVVVKETPNLDWKKIVDELRRHRACAAGVFALSMLRESLGEKVPSAAIEELGSELSPSRVRALLKRARLSAWFEDPRRGWLQVARTRLLLRDSHRDAMTYAIERIVRDQAVKSSGSPRRFR